MMTMASCEELIYYMLGQNSLFRPLRQENTAFKDVFFHRGVVFKLYFSYFLAFTDKTHIFRV